jgi:hypothetical protein
MKLTEELLRESIKKVIEEYLDYSPADLGLSWDDEEDPMIQSDAEYDESMNKYIKDNPNEFEKEFGSLKKPSEADNETIDTNDMPFESKKLNESQLRAMVREQVEKLVKENYPLGAQYDSSAPWNQTPDFTNKVTVDGTAYYANDETEEGKAIPFSVEVEAYGEYEDDWDEDGRSSYFVPSDNNDYISLVRQSGQVPDTIDGGFTLVDIDIDSAN